MKKHTVPALLIAAAIVITGNMGSMHTVFASSVASIGVCAGAAKAFTPPISALPDSDSEKDGTKQSKPDPEVSNTVDITISTSAGGQETEANAVSEDKSIRTGEIGGIAYDELVMANVQEAVNIRSEASEDSSIVGKFYTECGGCILDRTDKWTKVQTGEATGWISNDYLLFGDAAAELAEKVVEKTATCNTDCLRVRKEADPNATVLTLLAKGETIGAIDTEGDWVKVEFSDGDIGYISSEYVTISDELGKGETMEAIAAREEALKKEKEAAEEEAKRAKVEAGRTTETKLTNNGAIQGDVNDVLLLAALIQCEGGNQPYEGQVSVGTVVMNRLRSGRYGNSIYSVIYAKGQFGPAGSGKVAQVYAAGPKASCMQAAQDALNGVNYVGTATHFRNIKSGYTGIVIGSHVFW